MNIRDGAKNAYRHAVLVMHYTLSAFIMTMSDPPAYGYSLLNETDSLMQRAVEANQEQKYNQALDYLNIIRRQTDTISVNRINQQLYWELATAYKGKKAFKASFDAFSKYKEIYDSIYHSEKASEKQYQIDNTARVRQKAEIARQQIILKNNKAKLERKQMWVILSSTGAVLLLSYCFLTYQNYRKKSRINAEDLKIAKSQTRLANLYLEQAGIEGERQRISTSIRKEILPLLEQVDSRLRAVTALERQEDQDAPLLKEVRAAIGQASLAIEHALGDLDTTSPLPLEERIGELVKAVPDALQITLDIQGKNVFGTKQQQILFHIIEELLQNILKHAQANRAFIKLYFSATGLEAEVSDNGKGFSGSVVGFGLDNIRRQVDALNGRFEIKDHNGLCSHFFIPTESKWKNSYRSPKPGQQRPS